MQVKGAFMESLVDMDVNALKDAWARRQALNGDGGAAAQPAAAQQQQQPQPQQQAAAQVLSTSTDLRFPADGCNNARPSSLPYAGASDRHLCHGCSTLTSCTSTSRSTYCCAVAERPSVPRILQSAAVGERAQSRQRCRRIVGTPLLMQLRLHMSLGT